jgi:hypothetical protein
MTETHAEYERFFSEMCTTEMVGWYIASDLRNMPTLG